MRDVLPIKRPKRRPNPRGRGAAVTDVERNRIIDEMEVKISTGHTAAEAAALFKISVATFYRWRDKKNKLSSIDIRKYDIDAGFINKSIFVLTDESTNDYVFLYNLFVFSGYLRWPYSPRHIKLHAIISLTNYYRTKDQMFLRDLPQEVAKIIVEELDLDLVVQLLSYWSEIIDYEEAETRICSQKYTIRSWLSDIGLVIAEHQSKDSRNNSRLSINKLYKIMKTTDIFGFRREVGFVIFSDDFRNFAKVLPFLYVEKYYEQFNLILNPHSADFKLEVDTLNGMRSAISAYMSKCKFVVDTFARNLDRRTLSGISFPSFPSDLPAVALSAHGLARNESLRL